jgi:hypothetical protein
VAALVRGQGVIVGVLEEYSLSDQSQILQKQTEANVPGSYWPWERTGTCLQAKKEPEQCFLDSSRGR